MISRLVPAPDLGQALGFCIVCKPDLYLFMYFISVYKHMTFVRISVDPKNTFFELSEKWIVFHFAGKSSPLPLSFRWQL